MSPLRRGRPGLLGMAARTAVVAGTATAVSGNVQRRQQGRAQDAQAQAQADADAQAQAEYDAQQQQQQQQPAAPPQASGDSALLDQLNQLSQLHNAGVLSDTEFTAAKAKLLA
ncbi:SHOCT domain-containing protein [Cryobacterium adonitolivorans]|uniref:SHOCT domain-containing protein n=1 Tax=Cryobacterium adonitolivorans TaxID=1259189 RepID=A0A4R8VYH4_9MICO|nr:SHOCT domain-containing protein [Cryobacterium adonitolivorans]TFB97829.1 SHOCT domain-containing protein [Cryobacterium adonitolivorans]